MVICPGVEVLMVMFVPLIKVVGPYLAPLPSAANNCPVDQGAVEVPVPPLATDNWPTKFGIKVKVLAVEVEMVMEMLVSELVATWMEGPLIPETAVMAEVK
jgi:hypothetical protein